MRRHDVAAAAAAPWSKSSRRCENNSNLLKQYRSAMEKELKVL